MNIVKKQMWAKFIALVLAVATGLATAVSAVLALLVGIVPELQGDERAYEETVCAPLLNSYAALLWDGMDASEEQITGLDALDGGNLRYAVQRQAGSYYEELADDGYETLYANDSSVSADNAVFSDTYEVGANIPRYNLSSFAWAMRGAHYPTYRQENTWWVKDEVQQVLYDEKDGLFYFTGNDRYFLVPYFTVEHRRTADSSILEQPYELHLYELYLRDGVLAYYEEGTEEPLAVSQVKGWAKSGNSILSFGDWRAVFGSQEAVEPGQSPESDRAAGDGSGEEDSPGQSPESDRAAGDGSGEEDSPGQSPEPDGAAGDGGGEEDSPGQSPEPDSAAGNESGGEGSSEQSPEADGSAGEEDDGDFFKEPIRIASWELPQAQVYTVISYGGVAGDMNFLVTQNAERTVYRVLIAVCDEPKEGLILKSGVADYVPDARILAKKCYAFSKTWGWYLGISAVLFLLCFVFLMNAAGYRREDEEVHLRWIDRVPFAFYTGVVCLLGTGAVGFVFALIEYGFRYNEVSMGLIVMGTVLSAAFFAAILIGYCMSIAVRIKAKKFWHYTLCSYIWRPFAFCIRAVRENVAMCVKAGLVYAVVFLIELMCIASWDYYGTIMAAFILLKMVEIPVVIYILWQMNRLREGGKRIAAGDYSQPIDTRHMLWDFKKHAENLNSVSHGISIAVEERMKSERFRTELITNVSHDIKTPLTSIINYVDLIRKEEITSDAMREYVDVLQRQSQRLKKLIEDLMEASKASTGNLSVNMEPCDATVMLSQVVGEFAGRAEANQLELVVDAPEPPVEIMADGRHLWRVLDNLMSNICKYAMPGTRVYINLEVFHGMVIMTFRNISKSRLNVSSEELMERFVRGDSSRNTEGSGLGLNIAQSLTGLMNGNMALQVDGDLFKAIVSFQELKQETQ